jgi:hypothetical protein
LKHEEVNEEDVALEDFEAAHTRSLRARLLLLPFQCHLPSIGVGTLLTGIFIVVAALQCVLSLFSCFALMCSLTHVPHAYV